MSKYTLTLTLKQHTPLIHFQHDQAGATLRATEVKAKLDRFLVEQLFAGQFSQCKEHLIGYDAKNESVLKGRFENEGFRGLNYKLKITTGQVRLLPIGKVEFSRGENQWTGSFPCFFANMGDENKQNPKYFSMASGDIQIEIHSMDVALIRLLREKNKPFERFFSTHNFGTRQSKGFGSFSLTQIDDNQAYMNVPDNVLQFKVQASQPHRDRDKDRIYQANQYHETEIDWILRLEQVFQQIDLFYRTLRSGINIPNRNNPDRSVYFKSLMFHYARKDNYQWDKKTIRLHFYKDDRNFQEVQHNRTDPNGTVQFRPQGENRDGYDFRNLLGLSTDQSWHSYKDTLTRTGKTRPNQFNQSEKIERMKSPITFKPVKTENGYEVYVIPEQIPSEYLGAEISTKSVKNSQKGEKKLIIPDKFSTADYLRWAVEFYHERDDRGYFFGSGANSREANQIHKIYEQLKENLK